MGKSCFGIDNGLFKSQPLTLVDGDGPCKFKWVLLEFTDYILFDFLIFFVQCVFDVFPNDWFNHDFLFVAGADNADVFARNFGYFADFTIVIEFFSRGIIAHKHHLCPLFKQESG